MSIASEEMSSTRVFLLTDQILLRNNVWTLFSITQTVLKDVHAFPATATYVSLGTMIALYIQIICSGSRIHFALTAPRRLFSASDTSLLDDFTKEASYPGSLTDTLRPLRTSPAPSSPSSFQFYTSWWILQSQFCPPFDSHQLAALLSVSCTRSRSNGKSTPPCGYPSDKSHPS